ncbi:MAG: efflux RND transporter permease subunit [Polyangia bacterium]
MTALSFRNPIAVLMVGIALVVFAAVVAPRLSVDTFPELTPPVLLVGTLAPGLGPKDVEKTITWRIEKYVSATPGVDHVQSVSRNNLSIVYVWLKWGTDLNSAQTLAQQQVAFAMSAVPKSLGVLPPFVLQYDPANAPVIQVAVSGGGLSGPQLYDYAFNNIEPILEGIPGVASAAIDGGRQRQINVVVDPTRAQARGLTTSDVSAAVAESNALLPSGELISHKFDANVYTNAVATRVADIGDAVVKLRKNSPVLIRDVARVEDGGSPETQTVAVNGHDAVYLNVLRIPGGNVLDMVAAVKKTIAGLTNLPPGIEVTPIFDQSTFVRTSYRGLKIEVIQALLLIALVVLFFLQSTRGTLIVAFSIPLAFAVTLIVLYVTGNTLNAFTLGGLTLAMGPLVDQAVVVIESIHRHQRQGLDPAAAALAGSNAVALPVLASTLCTISVLLPVVLLAGLAKRLFVPLAITVAVSMIAAYFVSMMVTPLASRYILRPHQPGRLAQAVARLIDGLAERYAQALRSVLDHRVMLVAAAALLVGASLFVAARLPSTFFPEIDESMDMVYVRMAPGTSLTDARRKINEMGSLLASEMKKDGVQLVLTNIGSPQNIRSAITSPNAGPHMGFIRVALADPEHRRLDQRQIADRIRAVLKRAYPGTEFLQWPGGLVASVFSNGYLAPIVVELQGEDLSTLDAQARLVARVASTVPGIRDIYPFLEIDYPEIRVETNRTLAGIVQVTARAAAQATLDATLGNINTPSIWVDAANGQSYYVVTFYDPAKVDDASALARIPARLTDDGRAITLDAYGKVRRSLGPIAIERNHLARVAHVLMQTERRDIGSAAHELEKRLRTDPRTRGIPFSFVGQIDLMRTTFSGLGVAVGLAVMLVFMIMASQFKSLRLPFVMLFTIPVSFVGIVLALLAGGQGFSITALMGMLMVVGIAVSNGILLVDAANRRYCQGEDKVEAVIAAARSRLVPIAMTSLATIVGLVPTALGFEAGTESNRPLALAVVGGLSSSTLLSLFLVPVMFLLFARRPQEAPLKQADPSPVMTV